MSKIKREQSEENRTLLSKNTFISDDKGILL